MRAIVCTCATLLTLSGCGGGEALYSAPASVTCWRGSSLLEVSADDADYIALDASEGGFLIIWPERA